MKQSIIIIQHCKIKYVWKRNMICIGENAHYILSLNKGAIKLCVWHDLILVQVKQMVGKGLDINVAAG